MEIKFLTVPNDAYTVALMGLGLSYGKTSGMSYENFCGFGLDTKAECFKMDKLRDNMDNVAHRLKNMGNGHNKFLRSIVFHLDITAPLYWWKEFDTYKVGTVAQSESTMHTLLKHPITQKNFENKIPWLLLFYLEHLRKTAQFHKLNNCLPHSWKQRRIVTLNYEVVNNIIRQRHNHKLPEWRKFCEAMWNKCEHKWLLVRPYDLKEENKK